MPTAITKLALESGHSGAARTADVISLLEKAGYESKRTKSALSVLFDLQLIDTPEKNARIFNNHVLEMRLTFCGYYYYESLIRTLRYCQCVMQATHVCDEAYVSVFDEDAEPHERVNNVLLFI